MGIETGGRTLWRNRFGRGYGPILRQPEKLIIGEAN
jgi:hypothetical protein